MSRSLFETDVDREFRRTVASIYKVRKSARASNSAHRAGRPVRC
jgi:hypothetical protein